MLQDQYAQHLTQQPDGTVLLSQPMMGQPMGVVPDHHQHHHNMNTMSPLTALSDHLASVNAATLANLDSGGMPLHLSETTDQLQGSGM